MAFFSGYLLLYALSLFIAGKRPFKSNFAGRVFSLLPFAYALVGTLYVGLQVKNLYPDYSFENMKATINQPWLMGWGFLSILFWLPALARKPVLSLLHSLVFFFFLARDLVLHSVGSSSDTNVVQNDMKIYTDSLLLNLGALILVLLISWMIKRLQRKKRSPQIE
jgi:hypothetical protein